MLKQFDRYILKEIVPPFFLGLVAYTFIILLNQILYSAEIFIKRGVPFVSVLKLFLYLLPSTLSFTIPMAVLLGILAGLSRMSSDNEIMALKTLGLRNTRLMRPLLLIAFCGWLITSALVLFITPRSNSSWIQVYGEEVITKVQFSVRPRTFNETLPEAIIYIQDITKDKDWKNIFLSIQEEGEDPRIIFAKKGQLFLRTEDQKAVLVLSEGVSHSYNPLEPENYNVTFFESLNEEIELKNLLAPLKNVKQVREKDIAELIKGIKNLDNEKKENLAEMKKGLDFKRNKKAKVAHWIEIHKRIAIPLACFIFAFLALPLGVFTKKGGRTSGFTLSIVIILIYYILITAGEQFAYQGHIPSWLGIWGANILFFGFALYLFIKAFEESSIIPSFLRYSGFKKKKKVHVERKNSIKLKPRINIPFPNIIDRYILKKFLFIFFLGFTSMVVIFIIFIFFERIDTVYNHNKTIWLFMEYIFYSIPNFIHLVLPVAILISTFLSLGLLTKFNEITALKSCGISIYRTVVPLILFALIISFFSFYIQENMLPYSNQKAEQIWDKIRDVQPRSFNAQNRRWVMSKDGRMIFNYTFFDPLTSSFSPVYIYEIDPVSWELTNRLFAEKGHLEDSTFSLTNGWIRSFENGQPVSFKAEKRFTFSIKEKMNYFLLEKKYPDQMNFEELRNHISDLKGRNFETRGFEVDLVYKISFPLACLIMALIGIPFAFFMGKRGALVSLGISLAIAIFYWGAIGIFKNLGHIGYLSPTLAAWGPNIVFGLIGLYLFFSIRT